MDLSSPRVESRQSAAIERFVDVVRRYCAWAEEERPSTDKHSEMIRAQALLGELQWRALELALPEPDETPEPVRPNMAEEAKIRERFTKLAVDEYWDVFDPLDSSDRAAIYSSLAGDLSEIWGDLKEGLSLYEKGKTADAVWEWRFGFDSHWGRHLLGAQRAIYAYFS